MLSKRISLANLIHYLGMISSTNTYHETSIACPRWTEVRLSVNSKSNKSVQGLPAVVGAHGFFSTGGLGCTGADEEDCSGLTCENWIV